LVRAAPLAKDVVTSDSDAGDVNAAATPLRKRLAIRTSPFHATPPRMEKATKTPRETRKIRRRPMMSASLPPTSRKPPYPRT
jgi:hypothetical protein